MCRSPLFQKFRLVHRDVDPARVVRQGDKITAKVIALGETGKRIELSRRATLPNPWHEFARRVREGDVVRGTVRALHSNGVFVRIEAGIDGFVPLHELATWHVSKPDELLWLDDEVEAIVTHLDAHRERLALSIKARLEQRAQATRVVLERVTETQTERVVFASKDELPPLTEEERARVGQVIVVDDDDGLRNGLVEWLQRRGYYAVAARTREELERLLQSTERGVLLVDLHLEDDDGLELIRDLRANGLFTCIMSSPEWLVQRTEEIRAARVFQVFEKPLNENDIDQFLRRLARGETIQPAWKNLPHHDEKAKSPALSVALPEVTPTQRLQVALERVTEIAHAEKGIIFVQDPVSQTISIVAQAGELPLHPEGFYVLCDSPVKDVIVEKEPVFEENATANKRFAKLHNLLAFESCIGAPIEVLGEVHHALFLFHRQPRAFARIRPQYIELDLLWFKILLEEQAIAARLRALNPLLLSGELAMGLAHEVYNKASALELELANLVSFKHPPADLSERLTTLYNSARDLKMLAGSFQEMMHAKESSTTFNVNDVIRHAEMLVRPLARKEGVKIDLRLADNLPRITGNSIALQLSEPFYASNILRERIRPN